MPNRSRHTRTRVLGLAMLLLLSAFPVVAQGSGWTGGSRGSSFGIAALSNTNSIRVINASNPNNLTISDPLLTGQMGSFGGQVLDVAITPDNRTALISNFGDSKVFFLDVTNPNSPLVKGSVNIGFFAEDIDITPDGRYAIVTDGGFSNTIAVIDIPAKRVEKFKFESGGGNNTESYPPQGQSNAIMPDGHTILCANYWNGSMEVFLLTDFGTVIHTQSLILPPLINPAPPTPPATPRMPRPINVTVSPDGIHAVVLCVGRSHLPNKDDFGGPSVYLCQQVGPGAMILVGDNGYALEDKEPQSAAFSPDGRKLYVSATAYPPTQGAVLPPSSASFVRVFNVVGDSISLAQDIDIPGRGNSQLFGVDTIAIDWTGRYVFVTNPTLSDGLPRIDVVNTITNTVIQSFVFPDQTYDDGSGPDTARPIPTGIAFSKAPRFVRPGS